MLPHIAIVLDKRRAKKQNKYPVKLRVTFHRIVKLYLTVFDLTKEDYDKLAAKRITFDLQQIRDQINTIETAAKTAAQELDLFSFSEFEKEFIAHHKLFRYRAPKSDTANATDEFDYGQFLARFPILKIEKVQPSTMTEGYLNYIKRLLQEGRIGTAVNYQCSYTSLKKFRNQERFSDITPTYLMQYEQWLQGQGLSKSTIGMYMRPLRCIFNEAINSGVIKKEKCYPFGRRKYLIPTSRNIKKALSITEVEKIYYYECDPANSSEAKAKDFWLFCYFANGMNIKDVATLKYKDIHGEFLIFERAKTEKTMRSDPKTISVYINEDMNRIIERWGNKDKSASSYIFSILEPGITPLQSYKLKQTFIKFVNNGMRGIMKQIGIDKSATTYVARHTFSTVLKRSGASIEYIQEALGHVDSKTTENYLDSFEMNVKKEFASKLLAFKK